MSDTAAADSELPLVLAGPILRRLEARRLVFWLATRAPVRVRLTLDTGEPHGALPPVFEPEPGSAGCQTMHAGAGLHILLIDLALPDDLPAHRWTGYELALQTLDTPEACWQDWRTWAPDLCYPGRSSPGFVFQPRVAALGWRRSGCSCSRTLRSTRGASSSAARSAGVKWWSRSQA
ncbi:MAG: hypothetical protein ACK40L_16385 [Hydrogenophaga sp.]